MKQKRTFFFAQSRENGNSGKKSRRSMCFFAQYKELNRLLLSALLRFTCTPKPGK